jgi:hypothetical protein
MSVKTLIAAAILVGGTTTAAFAQETWIGLAGPGTPSYNFGCYSCTPGTGPAGLMDYAGPGYGPGAYAYAEIGPFGWDFSHTADNYLWFRSIGPGRGNDAASQR